jgi:hypothetical protein
VTSDPWEEMTRRWRDMYQEHAALAQKNWLSGQSQFATALAGSGVTDQAANAASLAELWRSWMTFGDSLRGVLPGVPEDARPGAGALGPLAESVSLSLASGGEVSEALRRMTDGPLLADVGSSERLMARVTELWLAVQKSARNYESVVASAWAEATKRFSEDLSKRYRTGEEIPDAKGALTLWLDTANQVLFETHRSEKFLDAQRQLLRDGMDFMLIERQFIEGMVAPAGLPTRTEIDEVHRSVQELKRRIRALEKTAAAAHPNQPQARKAAPTARRRRASTKGKGAQE